MKNTYTHGGSTWKSFSLLLRGMVNIAAFCGVWIGMLWRDAYDWAHTVFWISAAVFVLCIVFHLLIPLFRLFR